MNEKLNEQSPELVSWLAGAQKIIADYFAKDYPNLATNPVPQLTLSVGPKYIKIVHEGSRVHAFINRENGDVLKPASWNAPAKHARGNIFDASNGLSQMGVYGPAYLR